jgi:NitT/TauT family transport system permease protein
MRLTKIYAPVLTGPFLSGVIIATSNGVRVVVLAELLGAGQGIGYSLALARTNLETENLYALALLSMLIVCAVELVFLRPARKRIKRRDP